MKSPFRGTWRVQTNKHTTLRFEVLVSFGVWKAKLHGSISWSIHSVFARTYIRYTYYSSYLIFYVPLERSPLCSRREGFWIGGCPPFSSLYWKCSDQDLPKNERGWGSGDSACYLIQSTFFFFFVFFPQLWFCHFCHPSQSQSVGFDLI